MLTVNSLVEARFDPRRILKVRDLHRAAQPVRVEARFDPRRILKDVDVKTIRRWVKS